MFLFVCTLCFWDTVILDPQTFIHEKQAGFRWCCLHCENSRSLHTKSFFDHVGGASQLGVLCSPFQLHFTGVIPYTIFWTESGKYNASGHWERNAAAGNLLMPLKDPVKLRRTYLKVQPWAFSCCLALGLNNKVLKFSISQHTLSHYYSFCRPVALLCECMGTGSGGHWS